VMRSVPGAVATGSSIHTAVEIYWTMTRSLPLPVPTSSYDKSADNGGALGFSAFLSVSEIKKRRSAALAAALQINDLSYSARTF
jgi:hypothetical protein